MRHKIEEKIEGEIISKIRFADDILIITESEGDQHLSINEM